MALRLSLLISLLYFLLLIPLIGNFPIGSSTEAREVHVASIMLEKGDWILPMRDGILPSKPPLFHWLTAGSGALTGEIEPFDGRLISLIFAALTLAITIYGALKFQEEAPPLRVALSAALFLGASYGFMRLAIDARVDMVLCFFVTLAVAAIAYPLAPANQKYAVESVVHRKRDFIIFYISCVFAVLAKGPLGLILPFLTAHLITIYAYGLKKSLKIWLANREGIYIFLIFAPLWYYFAFEKAGIHFISKHIFFENLDRFSGEDFENKKPFWFYLPSFLLSVFPWSLFYFGIPIYDFFKGTKDKKKNYLNILHIWFFTGFILFSLAAGKRHAYLMPLFIPVAIYLSAVIPNLKIYDKIFSRIVKGFGLVCLIVLSLLIIFGPEFIDSKEPIVAHNLAWIKEERIGLLITCLFVFILGGTFSFSKLGKVWTNDAFIVLSLHASLAIVSVICLGLKNHTKNFENAASEINTLVKPEEKIYAVREKEEELLDPLLYYLKREVPIIIPAELKFKCGDYYIFEKKYRELAYDKLRILGKYEEITNLKRERPEKTILLARYECSPF
jgi:4-amino-4-deoxy-L-arabinose transferase-like glycosyltransferase